MKINKIYISAFGGLKDFTLELSDGLNVIYGNNEEGKSTVANFIKAMFFGTGRSSKNLSESLRQKYTPWDGSVMAGRIFFEDSGKKYCLEREFRKSDSTDRIMLTDLDSGKPIDVGENVGGRFFGLSAASFERSLFIGSGDFIKDDSAASEINGKLSNIAVTGTEDVSYKKIEKNIFDARARLISKSGRSGSYNEDLQKLNSLEEHLKKAENDAINKQELHSMGSVKAREFKALCKTQEALKQKLNLKQDFENRERLTEFLDTKHQLDKTNASLTLSDGTVVNEAFAQKVEFCIGKCQKSAERYDQINNDIKQIKETIELQNKTSPKDAKEKINALTLKIENLNEQKAGFALKQDEAENNILKLKESLNTAQNKKSAVNPILLSLSALAASIGAALSFVFLPITIALCVIAAVLLCLSFIIKPQNKNAVVGVQNELTQANNNLSEIIADKNRTQEQINNINAEINLLSSALNADAAVKAQRLADMQEKEGLLSAEKERLETAQHELFTLLSGFVGIDNTEKAEVLCAELKQKTEQQKSLKLQLKTASQYLGNIDYDDAKAKLDAINTNADFEEIDFDTVEAEYKSISEELSQLKDRLTAIATEIETSFRNSENPEEIKREILLLKEKMQSKKDFCDSADIAIEVLQQSFYELRRGYGSELETLTHKIFYELTDGQYNSITVSDTLDLSFEKADVFGTRELGYLSLGATHQAYLSLRLAIATLIADETPLPVFLDDALSQYDDTRTEKAIKYLKDYCKDGQGVMFTCHSSICNIAENQGIKILKPYGTKQ